jgi:hypothetical protein
MRLALLSASSLAAARSSNEVAAALTDVRVPPSFMQRSTPPLSSRARRLAEISFCLVVPVSAAAKFCRYGHP